jgi:hypothetical protein
LSTCAADTACGRATSGRRRTLVPTKSVSSYVTLISLLLILAVFAAALDATTGVVHAVQSRLARARRD